MAVTDNNTRFVFENADIRGNNARLTNSYRAILKIHQYPQAVAELLGEFLVAATLLSSTIKFRGSLTLQVSQPKGAAVIMAQCTSKQELRAIVRGHEADSSDNFFSSFRGGQLAITIEPENGPRYQGMVELAGEGLSSALESYFSQSEQLATRLWLASDGETSAGMLLQQLPSQLCPNPQERELQWEHVCHLAATVSAIELLELPATDLLHRLYHQESLRHYPPTDVSFSCSCSRERTAAALATVSRAELEDILETDGEVTMDCEFCNTSYRFKPTDVSALFGDPVPGRLH